LQSRLTSKEFLVPLVGAALVLTAALASRPLSWTVAGPLLAVAISGALLAVRRVSLTAPRLPDKDTVRLMSELRDHGRRLAIYDRETGLYAYWYLNLRASEEIERARRYGETFAVLLVEAARGRLSQHEERHLFSVLSRQFRRTDLVAHVGSLRFLVLLTNTDQAGSDVVVERLRSGFGPGEIEVNVALYPEDGADWPSLLASLNAQEEPSERELVRA